MRNIELTAIVILIFGISLSAECQKSDSKPKIKSLIVTDEKSDMIIIKLYKESETYYDQRGKAKLLMLTKIDDEYNRRFYAR